MVRNQMTFAMQCPMIGVLQDPYLQHAPARIEIRRGTKNIEKDGLNDFFRFAWISYNAYGDAVHQAVIAVEENGEGVAVTGDDIVDQCLVGERRKSLRGHLARNLAWLGEFHRCHQIAFTRKKASTRSIVSSYVYSTRYGQQR